MAWRSPVPSRVKIGPKVWNLNTPETGREREQNFYFKFENKLNVTPRGAPPKGVDSFRAKPGEGPGARVEDSAFGSQSSGSGRANGKTVKGRECPVKRPSYLLYGSPGGVKRLKGRRNWRDPGSFHPILLLFSERS